MNLNQRKIAKNPATSSGFFTFMFEIHFELRPACRRARNVVPICFIVEKFPRAVKGLGQGYMEVKDRNHPNCLPFKKGDLTGQLSQEIWPYRWEWLFAGLARLTWALHWSGGEGIIVFAVLSPWGGACYISPLPGGCVLAQNSQVLSRHSRCQ